MDKKRNRLGFNASNTLCWTCANAVPDRDGLRGCTWSRSGEPVEGWKARKSRLRVQTKYKNAKTKYVTSYEVRKCPMYEKG